EALARGDELRGGALAQRRGGESDVGGDVEAGRAGVGVERVVAGPERSGVDPAELEHEFAPGVVRIDRQQGQIEVEESEVHRGGPSSASICFSSGTVIARLLASENSSRRSSCAMRCLRSRAKRVRR